MRSIHQWLEDYGADHQNKTNKRIHWICVPLIVWSLLALLWSAPFPVAIALGEMPINWAVLLFVAGSLYYWFLSWRLALGLIVFNALLLSICAWIDFNAPWPLWTVALTVFVLAWIGQFVGHHIEGRKPSFLQDLQFLMIGPAWVISYFYRRVGLSF